MEHPATLAGLEPDAFAAVCGHLQHRELAALAACCASLRHAVASNDRLWAELYRHQFPRPWACLTQREPQQVAQRPGGGGGVAPGAWREAFLQTHDACHRVSTAAPCGALSLY